jgi:hypothetical protein
MCSCIKVEPSSAVDTGPSAVSTVVMLPSRSEESVAKPSPRADLRHGLLPGQRGSSSSETRRSCNPGWRITIIVVSGATPRR